MCLVAVYLQDADGSVAAEPTFDDVAHVECTQGEVIITPFLAGPQTIRGQVRSVDLVNNKIFIETGARKTSDT